MKKTLSLLLLSTLTLCALCTGCFSPSLDDLDYRTVPVTNNPYVVPNHGGGVPGGGSAASPGPY